MNVTTDKVINIFPFQFHPRREIVGDDTDSEERHSDEKKSEVLFNEDNQVCPQTEYDHQEQEDAQVEDQHVTSIEIVADTDSEERNSAEKISEVFDREIQDAQVSPKTLNEHQDAQVGDQPVTSIELQSSEEPKQATS